MPHKVLERLGKLFDNMVSSLAAVDCVIITFLMLVVTADVIARKLLSHPISWVLEVSELCMPAIIFLGGAWLLKKEGHITMDMVVNSLTPRRQALLNGATSIVGILICLVITWYGAMVTLNQFQRGLISVTPLGYPTFIRYAVLTFGMIILTIQFMKRSYKYLKNWRTAQKEQRLSESPF